MKCELKGVWDDHLDRLLLQCDSDHVGCRQIAWWLESDVQSSTDFELNVLENLDVTGDIWLDRGPSNAYNFSSIGARILLELESLYRGDNVYDQKVLVTRNQLFDILKAYQSYLDSGGSSIKRSDEIVPVSYEAEGREAGQIFKSLGGKLQEEQWD